jgi:hypothetical protein
MTLSVEPAARTTRARRHNHEDLRDTATGYRNYLRRLPQSMPGSSTQGDRWTSLAV